MSEGKELELESPTIRVSLVRGQHHLRLAGEITKVLIISQPGLAPALRNLEHHLSLALTDYEADVLNLENEWKATTECLETSKEALELEKAAVRGYIADLDRVRENLYQKNRGFVEAMQQKNQQHAASDCALEDAQAKLANYREAVRTYEKQIGQLQKAQNLLLGWLRTKRVKIPQKIIEGMVG